MMADGQRSRHSFVALMLELLFLQGLTWTSTSFAAEEQSSAGLVRLVRQDCGSCHGMTLNGGLGSPLTREALAGKPAESLVATILHGRPGTAMPAWRLLLSEVQAQWIVARLLEGFPEEVR